MVVDEYQLPELGEGVAQQREVVLVVKLADRTDRVHARLVTDLGCDRVAGIGGQGDRAATLQQVNDRADQTGLRILRVHLHVRHTPIVPETPIDRRSMGVSYASSRQ